MSNASPRDGGMKNKVVENFEKAIFAVVLLLAGYLVYSAFKSEAISDSLSPGELIQKAAKAEEHVEGTELDNGKIMKLFPKSEQNIVMETPPIDSVSFFSNGMEKTVTEFRVPKIAKRHDPELFAVRNLEIKTITAQLPQKVDSRSGNIDKIAALPFGQLRVRKQKEEVKRKPSKKKKQISPYGEGGPGIEGMIPVVMPARTTTRTVVPESITRESVGIRLGSMVGVKMINKTFVCVTGLLPFREQIIEYQKLREPIGYNADTDYPQYLRMEIERKDLDSPDGWVPCTKKVKVFANPEIFAVSAPEVVQAEYTDPRLTFPTLPFVGTDIVESSIHSQIPERDWIAEQAQKVVTPRNSETVFDPFAEIPVEIEKPKDPSELEEDPATAAARAKGRFLNPEDAPEFKMIRFYDLLNPGQRVQYRVRVLYVDVNLTEKLYTDNEAALDPKNQPNRSGGTFIDPRSPDPRSPEEAYYPTPGQYPSAASGQLAAIGHGNGHINETMLNDDVRDRLRAWKTSDRRLSADKDERYGLYTPWSEASPPSKIVRGKKSRFFVGPIVEPADEKTAGKVKYLSGEPKVEMSLTNWDSVFNYDVPGFAEVYRGSILDLTSVAKLIHPVTHTIHEIRGIEKPGTEEGKKEYEGYHFKNSAVVLSVDDGGQIPPDPGKDKEDSKVFRAPAELLIFDGEGGFVLRDELEDSFDFRKTALFEEKK